MYQISHNQQKRVNHEFPPCANPSLTLVPFYGKYLNASVGVMAEETEGGGDHLASAIEFAWIGRCISDIGG